VGNSSVVTTGLLHRPLREIKEIRQKNIALATAPMLITQLPAQQAAQEIQKLLQTLYWSERLVADKTQEVLEQLLAGLYEKQTLGARPTGSSYVQAENDQYLGKITENKLDSESILNEYGPYGSRYSTTSIFNPYSDYGSTYGANSVNNPYCSTPPKLVVNDRLLGRISVNPNVRDRIPTESFLYSLKHDLPGLLRGQIAGSEAEGRKKSGQSFIEAGDGRFLGN
jgi:hypothetical protein